MVELGWQHSSFLLLCCSVTQVVSNSLRPHGLYARPPFPHCLPEFAQVHVHCTGVAIQPSHPLMPSSPSALNLSQHQGLFQWSSDDQNTGTSAPASVLSVSIQGWSPLKLTGVWSPGCPRAFQESSPAPQSEDINSLVLCLFYGLALTTIHDHWEDYGLDHMDLCWQNNVSAFQYTV